MRAEADLEAMSYTVKDRLQISDWRCTVIAGSDLHQAGPEDTISNNVANSIALSAGGNVRTENRVSWSNHLVTITPAKSENCH